MPKTSSSVLTTVALGALAASILTGCSPSDDPEGGASSTPVEGGDAIYAVDTPFNSFDPNVAAAAQDARVMRQMYDSLVALDDERQPTPWLATEWAMSSDGLTYTFTLRDDVVFHDGTPFDAAAVCFNLDRIKNPESASVYAVGLIGPYVSCDAPDATTAVVTLAAPYAPFLFNLSSPFLGIVSPTAAQSMALADFAIDPVGSGPFVFDSYTPNDRLVLQKNPDYAWAPPTAGHEGTAYLDTLTFQIIPDATVRLGSLRNGSVQGVGNVPETDAAAIEADASLQFYAQSQSGSPFQLNFNTSRAPYDDPALRAAIRAGMNIDAAVQALYFGVYERAWGPLSPTTGSYDPSIEGSFEFDPEAAGSALDDLGWTLGSDGIREKDGQKLTLSYIEVAPNREKRQDIAEFVKANLADIGVDVTVRIEQIAGFQTAVQSGDYDIAGLSLVSVDPNVLYSLYSPQFIAVPGRNGFNFTHVDDAELTGLILEAQTEPEQSERDDLYARVQHGVIDRALSVGVYVPTYTVATNGLDGLRFDAEGYPVFFDSYLPE